jgi:hypothetical protein
MIELAAAAVGGLITWIAMGVTGAGTRNSDARDAIIRLSSAVEHIATQLEVLHADMRDERKETFGRLNGVEQRITKLEASGSWDGRNRRQ